MNWTLLQNSLLVAAGTTAAAVGLGFLAALFAAGLSARSRSWVLAGAVLSLAFPPFLVTNCWMHFLGQTGVWRDWLPLNIYSLGGTVWVLTLLTWPITLFLVLGDWRKLESSQLEGDAALRGWPLVRWLLIPQARPALTQALVLTFVIALNQFAVPALLQTKVLPAELWISFNTTFDYAAALWLSWPLLLFPLLLLFWLRHLPISWPRLEGTFPSAVYRRRLGPVWFGGGAAAAAGVLLLAVLLPLGQLTGESRTWAELGPAFSAGKAALWNSFFFAAAASTCCVLLAFLVWNRNWVSVFWMPFFLPGLLTGLALIYLLNRPGLHVLFQSAAIVVAGFTVRYLALAWKSSFQTMRSADADLADWAKSAGASRWQLWRHVWWPQIAPQAAAIWYVIYLLCLWDVETLILIVPPAGETLALRIFNLLHYGHNDQVNALCLLLLGLAVAPLVAWELGRWLTCWKRRLQFLAAATLAASGLLATGCSSEPPNQTKLESRLFSHVQVIGSRGTALGQFNKPRSVAVDREDNLYVVDMTARVQKFAPDGRFVGSWQMTDTDVGKPKGMCLDSEGAVIVIEPHYARVNQFSTEGDLLAQWGDSGTNQGQLMFPRAAAINSRGDIFISEYGRVERVQQFAAAGAEFRRAIGEGGTGPGQFNRAEGLGIDRQDRLYVADSCNHRIQVFSPDGQFLRSYGRAGTGMGELSYPYDIRIDHGGRQFVCEFGNSRVQIFDENDRPLEILGQAGPAPGQFSNPWSIALDSRGNLYVADSRNHRVQKFIRRHPEPVS